MATMRLQKPTEYDISFKYICEKCGNSHWLFLRETQANGFMVVCECGEVFNVHQIDHIDIVYSKESVESDEVEALVEICDPIVESAVNTIVSFGYDRTDATSMVSRATEMNTFVDSSSLVKYCLKNFGAEYV